MKLSKRRENGAECYEYREREKKHKNIILKHQKAHEKNTLETYIGGIYCL